MWSVFKVIYRQLDAVIESNSLIQITANIATSPCRNDLQQFNKYGPWRNYIIQPRLERIRHNYGLQASWIDDHPSRTVNHLLAQVS